jgi:hypothetical protein
MFLISLSFCDYWARLISGDFPLETGDGKMDAQGCTDHDAWSCVTLVKFYLDDRRVYTVS